MTYPDWVASVLAAAVLIPLLLHLRSPKQYQRAAAWRALLEHPHRPGTQWPWRPYDWERDGQ